MGSVICPSGSEWFFEDPEKAAALIAEAETWRDTPFRRGSLAKGVGGGTDCVGYDQCLYKVVDAIPAHINLQREKRRDYSRHCANDRVLQMIRGQITLADGSIDPQSAELAAIFAELPIDEKDMTGDLLVLRGGVSLFHMPVILDPPRFTHCIFQGGVGEGDITNAYYRDHLIARFRIRAQPR